jgi:hypothetical protein
MSPSAKAKTPGAASPACHRRRPTTWSDMEGYPHIQGGLEYLFGATYLDPQGQMQFIYLFIITPPTKSQPCAN